MQTAKTAKDKLCNDDAEWQKIATLTEAEDTASQQVLRARYCQGRIAQWTEANRKAAASIYTQLHQLGNNKLTDKSSNIQPGTFWSDN